MRPSLLLPITLAAFGLLWKAGASTPASPEQGCGPALRPPHGAATPSLRPLARRTPPQAMPVTTPAASGGLFGSPTPIGGYEPQLSGRVSDDRREGVGSMDVTAYDEEAGRRQAHTRTDYDGRWRLRVSAGLVRVDIRGSAGNVASRTFSLHEDDEVTWDLDLKATRFLRGTFTSPRSAPRTTFEIRIHGPGGRGVLDADEGASDNHWTSLDDPHFRFLLRDRTMPYWLVVTGPDASVPCYVAGPFRGPQRDFVLRVPPARLWEGQITGRLVSVHEGESRTAIVIDAHGFHTYAHLDRRTGEFEITNLPAGSYRFRLEDHLGMVLVERTVTLEHGRRLELGDISLPQR